MEEFDGVEDPPNVRQHVVLEGGHERGRGVPRAALLPGCRGLPEIVLKSGVLL